MILPVKTQCRRHRRVMEVILLKQKQIKCPYCHAHASLRPASLVYGATPGFCYHDRSGWRAYPPTYMTMQCPLWIIAEDAATGRRLWITQEGTRFSISIRRMDEQRHNYGPTYRITCENRTKLAQVLRYQFESKTLAV